MQIGGAEILPGELKISPNELQVGDVVVAVGHRGNYYTYAMYVECLLPNIQVTFNHSQHEKKNYWRINPRPLFIRARQVVLAHARTCECGVEIPASLAAFRHLCKDTNE